MAVSTKGKRKISVNGKNYLWKVFNEYDQSWFDGVQVMIIATDQSIIIRYGTSQPNDTRHIVVQEKTGKSIRYKCPIFEEEVQVLKPRQIKSIIKFAISENNEKT